MPASKTTTVSRPKAYLQARHKIVKTALTTLGLDGLLLAHPPDLAYLTNFTGDDSVGIFTSKRIHLVTDFRYQEQAEIEAPWLTTTIRAGAMVKALAEVIIQEKLKRIGFEANLVTVGQVEALRNALAKDGQTKVELVPLEDVLIKIRMVKDDHETGLIRKSIACAQEAFEAFRTQIQVGQTENYLAGLLILEMRSRGAADYSFPCILASGAPSSLPHYRPTDALVQTNQPLLVDFGALFQGYCSDLTRTLMIGRVPAKMKDIYRITLEAQEAAIAFLRPGVTTIQADRVARDVIDKAGYGKYFGHGLGHGIGREIHELPSLSKNAPEIELRPGMIVTVEPGIYLPGIGGVRIEDDVLITHSGCEVLSSLDKSYEANLID